MEQYSPVLVITPDHIDSELNAELAKSLGYDFAHAITGGPAVAAEHIQANNLELDYILLDIGARTEGIFQELDILALHCTAGVKIVVTGQANDIQFYRALIGRGISEYLVQPVTANQIEDAFKKSDIPTANNNAQVFSCISAAAGDGSTTVATSMAHCLANEHHLPTVLIDLDYQFGMVAKSLDLSSPYGIKELFEHPDRGIDSTLVERMLVTYKKNLHVIAAPNDLRYLPDIQPETIKELIRVLSQNYQYIILDIPHMWAPWVTAALTSSNHIILVAQLWLKSVMHAARLMNVCKNSGIVHENMLTLINRSGAKFKEAVNPRDYERVCNTKINFYIPNDIKTVVSAENSGCTILEVSKSKLSEQMRDFVQSMLPNDVASIAEEPVQTSMPNPLKRLL